MSIAERFEATCRLHHDRVAVEEGDRALTYGALGRWVAAADEQLRRWGVDVGDRVGVALPRSIEAVVACLATIRAGAAFVPLPPDWPPARLDFVRRDAEPAVVLGSERALPPPPVDGAIPASPPRRPDPESPVTVLYTSGSTGRPKGVVLPHRALEARLLWDLGPGGPRPGEGALHRATPGFIDAATECLVPLLAGARLFILPGSASADVAAMGALIERRRITRVTLVPTVLGALLERGLTVPPGSRWTVSGEPLLPELLAAVRAAAPALTVRNLYGSTEVSGDATGVVFEAGGPGPIDPVPIGRPIAGARIHVLGPDRQPVASGEIGEIHVGGPILATGYHRLPEQTAAAFVEIEGAGRVYRTGDRGRWAEGLLYFHGRADHQVKLAGVRIELGEVEAALRRAGAERAAVVLAEAPRRLVAFVNPPPVAPEALRAAVAEWLPTAAVPAAIVGLDPWPTTPSGKPDRRAMARLCDGPLVEPPTGPLEAEIARLLCESLGGVAVGRRDSLRSRGGDSLAGATLLSRLRARFDLGRLDAAALAERSVARLARDLAGDGSTPGVGWPVEAADVGERAALVALAARVFAEREPLAVLCRVTAEDVAAFARPLFDVSVAQGLAWLIRSASGEIVAFCACCDLTQAPSAVAVPAMGPTMTVLGWLTAQYLAQRGPIEPGQVAEIAMTGVAPGHDGLALAERLEAHALTALAASGFRRAMTICTHPVTAALSAHLGFEAVSRIRYAHVVHDGRRVFADRADPDAEAVLFDRALTAPARGR